MPREQPLLKIKIHGRFKPGRIPVPLLLKVCGEAQAAVNRQAESLEGKRTLRPGPVIAAVSRECTLELFGLKKGTTTLDFARAADQQPLIQPQTIGFDAVIGVGAAIKAAARRRPLKSVPLDTGVLDTLNKMGEVFEKGVEKIEWIVPRQNGTKRLAVAYIPEIRTKIAARIQSAAPNVPSTVEGTLELAAGTCRITTAVGIPTLLAFEPEKAAEVYEAMHKPVKARVDPKTRKIQNIEIQKDHDPKPSFFVAKTIDQLIAEQGVRPIVDLNVLSGALPDDDVDEMVAEIYRARGV